MIREIAGICVFRLIMAILKAVSHFFYPIVSQLKATGLINTLAFNSATDLYLAAFSTYVFWHLNLKLQVKLGLIVLLGLGLL